jgi:phosphatidylglycerophosphate synthase
VFEGYKATLKPLAVEEPIDVFWHRLAGYAIARASFPTPISADALTVFAILIGVLAGGAIAVPFARHMLIAAVLLELSAAFDCADGQLARMRKKSSEFGRMLDGVSDSIVMAATFLGTMIHFADIGAPAWMIFLAAIAAPTCSFHFAWYDHYKNIYLRMIGSSFREGEDVESARARYASFEGRTFILRFVWWVYLRYVSGQAWLLRWSDPYSRFDRAPANVDGALGTMRIWRSLYGLGTHIFLFSLACAFDRIDIYLIFRVGVLNVFAFVVLLPWQRRVSRRAFS